MNTQQAMHSTGASWPRAVLAETVKLWTLLSNRLLLLAALLMIVGSGTLMAVAHVGRLTDPRFAGQHISVTPQMFVDSVLWAQVIVAIVAVLAVVNEYTSGQIRLSLLALPTRSPWLGAKTIVIAAAGFLLGAIGSAISLGISVLIIRGTEVSYAIEFGQAAQLCLKSGLYLAAIGMLAVGIAALARNAVAALAAVLALLVVVPPILNSIPVIDVWSNFLPTIAGRRLISELGASMHLDPWAGFGVLALWTAIALAAAFAQLRSRDA